MDFTKVDTVYNKLINEILNREQET
jgi:hypothetical protein